MHDPAAMSLSAWSNEDAASLGTLDRLVALRGTSEQPASTRSTSVVAGTMAGGDSNQQRPIPPNYNHHTSGQTPQQQTAVTTTDGAGAVASIANPTTRSVDTRSARGHSSGIVAFSAQGDGFSLISGASGITTNTTGVLISMLSNRGQNTNIEVSSVFYALT